MKHGKAILIATDVWNPPKSVKKLASSLNAKIFSPKSNLSVSYKTEIVNDFLKNINDFSIDFSGSNIHPNNYTHGSVDAHERDSLSAAILAFNNYKNKLTQLERKFLEAKMSLNSIDKESIINENYYEILNQSKSFLINDRSISDSINMAFESYNLIENEDSNAQVPDVAKINISGDNVTNTTTTTTTTNINNNNNNNNNIGNNTCIIDSNNYNNKDYNNNNNIDIINNNIGYSNVDYNNIDSNVDSHIDSNDIENIGDIREDYNILGEKVDKLKKINKSQEKQIKNQDKLLEKLKNKNELLANELTEKNEKILKIEKELKESKFKESKAILKDKEVASKIKLLKTIQFKYKEEKELRKSLEEKLNKRLKLDDFNELSIFTPIKIINSFTKNGIKEADNLFKLKRGDVIYLASSEGGGSQTAKFIVDLGIKAIVANKNNESIPPQAEEVFENEEIPIINENQLDIKFFDDYAVADSKILEEKINNWKTQSKEKTTKKAQEDLLNVINEYRVERKRDV